jgi:hypothetical protein
METKNAGGPAMTKTVGRFTYDTATGSLTGPKEYVESEQYRNLIRNIEAGQSYVFNYGAGRPGADVVTALLVTVQTDYAGWHGSKVFFAGLEAAK